MAIKVSDMNSLTLIVQAKFVEDCTKVRKVKGTKEYTLRRKLKIYGENRKQINCEQNHIFLVDSTGNIDMIDDETEVVVTMHPEDLFYDIQFALDEDSDK